MYYLRYAVIACLAVIASVATASQGRAEWEMLGEKAVGFGVDRDVIHVGRHEGRFERLMLRVSRNDIEVLDLRVVYANGEADDIHVRHFIHADEDTRPLDLQGDHGRRIERIELTYRSRPSFRGEAVVQVYGDSVRGRDRDESRRGDDRGDRYGRDEGRRGDRGDNRADRGEQRRAYDWELLGSRKVGLFADHDSVEVGHGEGKFRKIKLRVRGNDIEFYDLKVVYGNGEVDDISVREKIREGSETRPLDLRGRDRVIRRIEMSYGRMPNFRGSATVEVWGLQVDD
jgi:hypothetical protein